ncbi:DUF397 domain-containing protein [Streptomyces sp. NPDC059875]|uniref:DUF397 domain-containing protein n=1 Tax=unclassified Streptomyces TaxID=2593676 RepID=UPI00364F959F
MSETLRWFKSSYSDGSGGECVEVAYTWHKSTYCSLNEDSCVEVATCPHAVHLRDSKVAEGPTFTVAPASWSTFVAGLTG